jgi:hypothetical protein
VGVDGDAAAVVGHPASAVGQQRDVDAVAVARHRLVDGVVDHLPNEVVQATGAGAADVHARSLAYRIETFQDRDVLGPVAGRGGRLRAVAVGCLHRHWARPFNEFEFVAVRARNRWSEARIAIVAFYQRGATGSDDRALNSQDVRLCELGVS